ncbi:ribonuclease HIII [Enterococcus sp. 669A]|uniref:Ribonuclease HIII n=1 Tax=Candidatus Enterococcus moelleringii TaxID=2815325 RepID=A0ABS3LFR1_9ENTE|nr:ribonuclease HIII [Enterococcus sp. 669A]MBO1308455.1 ribonuclease HIII [Enterococcus sp. 669A]
MSSCVLKLSKIQLKKLQEHYQNDLLKKNIPYSEFSAKKNGVSITAYTSGKVVFQGKDAEAEASKWGSIAETPKKKSGTTLPAGFAQLSVIGSDEVGNGSYFGPLCVCAAYAEKEHLAELNRIGVKDSKMLTDPQIRQIAEILKELIPYKLLVVTPKKYNEIQPKYNAVHMKVALHNQAISLLLAQISPQKPEAILIDQFTPPANYQKYVKSEVRQVKEPIYFTTKGEQYHLAVAAASIISRASFLEELDQASQALGIKVPSGAGAPSDKAAAALLKRGGIQLLSNYAKLHFANTEKAQKLL